MLATAMFFLAQVVTWDFFQNFCIVIGAASSVFIAGFALCRWSKQEFAEKQSLKELTEHFERELENLHKAYEIQRITDASRFDKLEKDYDETIRLLSISRMLQPGTPLTRPGHSHKKP